MSHTGVSPCKFRGSRFNSNKILHSKLSANVANNERRPAVLKSKVYGNIDKTCKGKMDTVGRNEMQIQNDANTIKQRVRPDLRQKVAGNPSRKNRESPKTVSKTEIVKSTSSGKNTGVKPAKRGNMTASGENIRKRKYNDVESDSEQELGIESDSVVNRCNVHNMKKHPRALKFLQEVRPCVTPSRLDVLKDSSSSKTNEQVNDRSVKRKSPPAKGLVFLKELRKRRQTAEGKLHEGDDDDEYVPSTSSDSEGSDFDDSDSSSDNDSQVISSDVAADNYGVALCTEGNEWCCVKKKSVVFGYVSGTRVVTEDAITAHQKPIEYYRIFLDASIMQCMVDETNRNAQQVIMKAGNVTPNSRLNQWQDTDIDEMEKFIGLLIWMGLVKLPSIADYWSTDKLYRNGIAKSVMARNRFQALLRMWHFADNDSAVAQTDRLHKIRHIQDLLVANFCDAREPGENIVIDESMVPFRGRLKFKQYLPGKAHKYGIKLYKLCDSSGYTYNVNVYSGKSDRSEGDQATTVVMRLMERYLDVGRTLCTDNFYTSLTLAEKLLQRKTHLVGTLRKNRKGLPKSVLCAKLKRGESASAQNTNGVVVQKWVDRREVLTLSTKHGDELVEVTRKNRTVVRKPEMVIYYNTTKQGIDISDQLAAYHTCLRKTVRWYHKVVMELLLGTAVVNSLILYNDQQVLSGQQKVGVTKFREQLCRDLMQLHSEPAVQERSEEHLVGHYLRETQEREGGKRADRRKRRYCIGCYDRLVDQQGREVAKKKAKRVTTECAGCDGNPRFCFVCFPKFHCGNLKD